MFEAYKCKKCGEMYLGDGKPLECPFCGAEQLHLKSVGREDMKLPELKGRESMDIRSALDFGEEEISEELMEDVMESLSSENFMEAYRLFAKHTSEKEASRFFKALSQEELGGEK